MLDGNNGTNTFKKDYIIGEGWERDGENGSKRTQYKIDG